MKLTYRLKSNWEELINGKYRRWYGVCNAISFIYELTENNLKVIVEYGTDWDKLLKLDYKLLIHGNKTY